MKQNTSAYYAHPVFNPLEMRLETAEIKQLQSKINQWLWTGATGGLIQGESRVGKSTALEMLVNRLQTRGKRTIPAHVFSVPPRDKPSIASVFRNLCISADMFQKRNDRADDLAERFTHFLLDKAAENQSNRVVLLVDEMQRLLINQLEAFAELYDLMCQHRVSLTVIFTGNEEESNSLLEQIQHRSHIRGRFFTQGTQFRGVTNEKDLKLILRQYDCLRFPNSDSPTYTQYFLPGDFDAGWRLEQISNDIWQIYRQYQRDLKLNSWGMQYCLGTINPLLTDYLPRYGVARFSEEMVHECIKVSGLLPSIVRVVE